VFDALARLPFLAHCIERWIVSHRPAPRLYSCLSFFILRRLVVDLTLFVDLLEFLRVRAHSHVQWTLLPLIIALALLRNLKYLAFTSILGDVAVALCAAFVLVFGAQHHAIDTRLPAANFDKFPAFFASVCAMEEGCE
jgi:hypothetical protein